MLSPIEAEDIRQLLWRELAALEQRCARYAGSYTYVCNVAGGPVFTHRPVGQVIRHLVPHDHVV